MRHRYVGNGIREDIVVRNLGRETAGVLLLLEVDADFAGLFEVKEGRARRRDAIEVSASASDLSMSYQFGADSRAVRISGDTDAKAVPGQITWQLVVEPRADVTVSVQVIPAQDGVEILPRYTPGQPIETSQPAARHEAWRQAAPLVSTPEERLGSLLATSAEDIGALRMFDPDHPDRVVVAAGVPWFMTLFGHDSLLTSWMLLPVDPTVALGTLQTLAQLQGNKVDPLTEEEPGRILHELRAGPDAEMALGGGNLYYGSIDSTPLFVMLLGELRRWGLATSEVDALVPHADRALEWMEQFGDRDGDGFIEYQRATDRGLVNQGWKDSFDGINFAAGDLARTSDRARRGSGLRLCCVSRPGTLRSRSGRTSTSPAIGRIEHVDSSNDSMNRSGYADRGYFAIGARCREAPDRCPGVQHGTLPLDRNRRRRQGRFRRAAHDEPGDVHGLRGAHPCLDDGGLQPHELPQWLGLAP